MYQIDNEKFGVFIAQIRKEKGMTQKELGECLFVSDKTVSKWERGLSMPNVVLLMPIADILGVTVTELLRGERMQAEQKLDSSEVEGLVAGSLGLSLSSSMRQHKRAWTLAFVFCALAAAGEVLLLYKTGMTFAEMGGDVLVVTGLMLLFGGWFCIFAKEQLPAYFDENEINYYAQGIFRMHITGLSFNNKNWPYICTVVKIWTLSLAVLFPLICLAVRSIAGPGFWDEIKMIIMAVLVTGMFISVYAVGKKHGKSDRKSLKSL